MVKSCCAVNCTTRFKKGVSFYKFPKDHELAKKWVVAMKRDKWKPTNSSFLCFKHFKEGDYAVSGWSKVKKLKPDAIPTNFDFPAHLIKEKKERPSPKRGYTLSRTCTSTHFGEESLSVYAVDCVENGNKVTNKDKPEPSKEQRTDTISSAHTSSLMNITLENENAPDHDERSETISVTSEPPLKQKKKRQHYVGDFECSDDNKALKQAKKTIDEKNKKLKLQNKKIARMTKKIQKLEQLVDHLKENFGTTDIASQALLSSVPESSRALFSQMLSGGGIRGKQYPAELKCFA